MAILIQDDPALLSSARSQEGGGGTGTTATQQGNTKTIAGSWEGRCRELILREEELFTHRSYKHLEKGEFLNGGGEKVTFDVYDFLQAEDAYVAAQPGLAALIRQTVEAAQAYETRCKVTTGVIWADRIEILQEQETGRVGIIDC